jgi:hypothetical protein
MLMLYLSYEIGYENLVTKYLKKNPPPAKADFFAIPIDLINENVVMFNG